MWAGCIDLLYSNSTCVNTAWLTFSHFLLNFNEKKLFLMTNYHICCVFLLIRIKMKKKRWNCDNFAVNKFYWCLLSVRRYAGFIFIFVFIFAFFIIIIFLNIYKKTFCFCLLLQLMQLMQLMGSVCNPFVFYFKFSFFKNNLIKDFSKK